MAVVIRHGMLAERVEPFSPYVITSSVLYTI